MNDNSEKIKALLNKYFLAIQISVVVVLFGIGTYMLLLPEYGRLKESGVLEHQAALDALHNRQQYLTELTVMEEDFKQVDTRIFDWMATILPTEQPTNRLFEELELLANDSGFIIQSIALSEDVSTGVSTTPADENSIDDATRKPVSEFSKDIKIVHVTLNLASSTASYDSFKRMLALIEQYDHLIDLESISYSADTQAFTLLLRTYQKVNHE